MYSNEFTQTRVGKSDASTIESIREVFDSELNSNGRSSIEKWLDRVPAEVKPKLFAQLLEVEVQFCQKNGTDLDFNDYRRRFPEFSEQVHSVFEMFQGIRSNSSNDNSFASTKDAPTVDGHFVIRRRIWKPGDLVGRYRLDKFLGRGSFGEVWKGFDPELNRVIAIKVPRDDSSSDPNVTQRFREEARCAAMLHHEGIVPVYDVGKVGAGFFIVSEFIDGPTLARRMADGDISRQEAIRIVRALALTLHKAHQTGLIHRDIKPQNILIRKDGNSAITDFGLAVSEEDQLTLELGVVGTIAYMSPEQARGETRLMDGRSDLYSLGVILFQLLTGRLPFQHRNQQDLLEQIRHREVRSLRSIDDSIPANLDEVCRKCLSKEISGRYAVGGDLATALDVPIPAIGSPRRIRPVAAAMVAVAALIVTATMGLWRLPPSTAMNSVISQIPGQPAAASEWLPMLDHPLDKVVWLKSETTDFLHDQQAAMLIVRAENTYSILATDHHGSSPLRIRGSIFMDNWIGTAGFVWGWSQDPNAFPKKPPRCYVCLIERMTEAFPLTLSLREVQTHECSPNILCIESLTELSSKSINIPAASSASLEMNVDDAGITVLLDGNIIWKPESIPRQVTENLTKTVGRVGILVRGRTVIMRDAAVKFSTR